MSKSSARRRKVAAQKAAPQQAAPQAAQSAPASAPKQTSKGPPKGQGKGASKGPANTKAQKSVNAKRGSWLTGALALMTVDAVVSAVLPFFYHKATVNMTDMAHPWFMVSAIVVGLLGLAGVILMWYWKRLGIYLFLASVAGSIVLGMLVFPSQLAAFHAMIPLLVLGAALSHDKQLPLFK